MAGDRFSKQAQAYARFRPAYPEELFLFLRDLCREHDLAWDCGTGNGQAARSLARHFGKILATDPSAAQIANASGPDNIVFRELPPEDSPAEESTVDLITIAQAAHWFDHDAFHLIANKVLKPGGVIAAWGYGFFRIEPGVDAILDPYGREFLASYWSERNRLLIDGYKNLPFPFPRLPTPDFTLEVEWNLHEVEGYLESWSATQKYKDAHQRDPLDTIAARLGEAWGESEEAKTVRWDLHLLVGRVPGEDGIS